MQSDMLKRNKDQCIFVKNNNTEPIIIDKRSVFAQPIINYCFPKRFQNSASGLTSRGGGVNSGVLHVAIGYAKLRACEQRMPPIIIIIM